MILKNLTGFYYVYDYRTKSHSQEYLLEILEMVNNKIEFIFQKIISGNFGSSGIIWKGNCVLQDNKLSLEAFEKKDWTYTAIQEEKEEIIQSTSDVFNFELLKGTDTFLLRLVLYDKTITLDRLNKNIEKSKLYSISFSIIQEIINQNKLKREPLEFEPSRFWRISNFLLKSYKEIKINNMNFIELICEYDLEFVKEEKRVVENDEILREHRVDRVIFNQKNKIIKYENLE